MRNFLTFEMGPIGCPETSVINYHYSLRNNPEEHSSVPTTSGQILEELFHIKMQRIRTNICPEMGGLGV